MSEQDRRGDDSVGRGRSGSGWVSEEERVCSINFVFYLCANVKVKDERECDEVEICMC